MSLSDYKPPKRKIEFDGGSFEVRAISLPDVAMLIDLHERTIAAIVTKIRERQNLDFDSAEIMVNTIMEVVRESPMLAANIISLCADEQDQMQTVLKLPLPVQIDALQQIANVTFTDLASVKKFIADAMRLVKGILPPTPVALAAE
jgi:hypothetical protein